MKSTLTTEGEGYGYNTAMLPNYDGFIIIKPGFLGYTDDVIKSAEYMKRYNALKSSLMMAEGYGIPRGAGDE